MKNVVEYLLATAARLPDAPAYSDEKSSFSFAQTLDRVRRLGCLLHRETGALNRPIAVLVRRDAASVLGCFSALWAGCCYVPIDAAMPADRMNGILESLEPAAILIGEADRKKETELAARGPVYYHDGELPEADGSEPWRAVLDADPCYMIYTSGSTGVPKGILISHRSVIDFTEWYAGITGVDETDRLGNQAPFFFDLSVKDLYLTLKTGAGTYVLPKKVFSFPVLLIRALDEQRITTLSWSTAAFHMTANSGVFEKYQPQFIKRALMGGEAMQAKQLNIWRKALPDVHYVNLYGPTETTVDCTWYPIDREFAEGEPIPIGRACENMEVLILSEEDRLCGVGEIGELCARGTGIAIGYFRDPEKTAKSFVQNPLNPHWPDRIYRTGDLGWRDENGLIWFAGRKDSQVKHNGYRIELGEIETALSGLPGMREAVCFFDSEADRIIAVYAGSDEAPEVAKALHSRLPKYMIPEIFRRLEALPHLPNGKLDRVRIRRENP